MNFIDTFAFKSNDITDIDHFPIQNARFLDIVPQGHIPFYSINRNPNITSMTRIMRRKVSGFSHLSMP